MITVRLTLDAHLVEHIDRAARRLGITRSAFARRALRADVEPMKIKDLEQRHREGYARKPVRLREFDH